ncbi:hypothetical protein LS73_003685 [Helicobacter muridarum]|uniref:DNA replication regulator family protein n=1 Tax=Helicobacter muridarum TaxID=216 RepID=A0A099TXX3_9HELI|nr:HobA family DNA replication regulator [Helicobacter muridarum]TLE00763.1 hypothetical protein LS73_003685 [Helicobacter muridarum]STQ86556.1 DNA replication regulator family protein [Helicobacter muridarum]
MGHINEWMLQTLRDNATTLNCPLQWLEFQRLHWTPLVMQAVSFIVNGGTFLLCVDHEREWLQYYIMNTINNIDIQRPFVPIYALDSSLIKLLHTNDNQAVRDMLDMSYPRYAFWYIGKCDNAIAQFALDIRDSFLWIFDEPLEHSFVLDSKDKHLDFKLLQAFRIFESALFAGICGEFEINIE